MSLEGIRAVLDAPDLWTRNERIASRLGRLEGELGRTRRAVASLRDLLACPPADIPAGIEMRNVRPAPAAAILDVVDVEDSVSWLQGALGELHATLAAQDVPADGHSGGIFAEDMFTHHRGPATVFIRAPAPFASTTWSASTTPQTPPGGGPRSAGPSSRPPRAIPASRPSGFVWPGGGLGDRCDVPGPQFLAS
jgi:hypothetical protein